MNKTINYLKNTVERIINWLLNTKIFLFPRKILWKMISCAIRRKGIIMLYYNDAKRKKVIDLINRIRKKVKIGLTNGEAYQLFMAVKKTEKIEGDIAEVGVFKGGSARIICEAKGDRTLHLFDTFCGFLGVEEIDAPHYYKGQFDNTSLACVKHHLENYKKVFFYEGLFPTTAEPIKDKRFSFVNLDVDLYKSTLDCLDFFYPRMSRGGIIMSHDYNCVVRDSVGVKKAIDEFFKDKPEPVIEMSDSHCLIVKL